MVEVSMLSQRFQGLTSGLAIRVSVKFIRNCQEVIDMIICEFMCERPGNY